MARNPFAGPIPLRTVGELRAALQGIPDGVPLSLGVDDRELGQMRRVGDSRWADGLGIDASDTVDGGRPSGSPLIVFPVVKR